MYFIRSAFISVFMPHKRRPGNKILLSELFFLHVTFCFICVNSHFHCSTRITKGKERYFDSKPFCSKKTWSRRFIFCLFVKMNYSYIFGNREFSSSSKDDWHENEVMRYSESLLSILIYLCSSYLLFQHFIVSWEIRHSKQKVEYHVWKL